MLQLESSRLSVSHLAYVVLGAIFSGWASDTTIRRDYSIACRSISLLHDTLKNVMVGPNWLNDLGVAAAALSTSSETSRQLYLSLMTWGQGKGSGLLGDAKKHPKPLFNLTDAGKFLPALTSAEHRIALLRLEAGRHFPGADPNHIIIRYIPDNEFPRSMATRPSIPGTTEAETNRTGNPQIIVNEATEENYAELGREHDPAHVRTSSSATRMCEYASALPYLCDGCQKHAVSASGGLYHKKWGHSQGSHATWSRFKNELSGEEFDVENLPLGVFQELRDGLEETKISFKLTSDSPSVVSDGRSIALDNNGQPQCYTFFMGDVTSAAIFVLDSDLERYKNNEKLPYWARKTESKERVLRITDINTALERKLVQPKVLERSLTSSIKESTKSTGRDYFLSLSGFATLAGLYAALGDATISPEITARPLSASKWLAKQAVETTGPIFLRRPHVFACITYLDSGHDIPDTYFKNVMAVSSGDSIYVATALLDDPLEHHANDPLRRIVGNVGKPGVVLLVPPPDPIYRKLGAGDWRVCNIRQAFDGNAVDAFQGTSLSLSFTDWHTAVNAEVLNQRLRSTEVEIHEAVVSVHMGGQWVADVDILDALSKSSASWDHEWYYKHDCSHKDESRYQSAEEDVRAITTWEEFLDNPSEPVIMLTHGNWKARLAAVAMGVRRHDRIIATKGICWDCWRDLAAVGGKEIMSRAIFVI